MTTKRDYALQGDLEDEARRVPISEARAQLSSLVKKAEDHDIILMNHGRPAAVLMSPDHYRALLDELDELQDRLAVQESDGPAVPFGHLLAELDLTDIKPEPHRSVFDRDDR